MNALQTVAGGAALALAFAIPVDGPASAQEERSAEATTEQMSIDRIAARVLERAEVLATRVEERGERLAARVADRGRKQLAARIEQDAEQDADNIRKTGDYLATCIQLDAAAQDCEPHGYAERLIPDDVDQSLFDEAGAQAGSDENVSR